MKKCIYILLLALLYSCDDFLDLPPLNKVTENDVFESEAGINAYLVTLYNHLPIEDFNYGGESGFNNWVAGGFQTAISCDEAIHAEWPHEIYGPKGDGMWFGWWAYDNVRNVNTLIEKLNNSTIFTGDKKKELLAEAYAIRAWYYFGMAKRYGGIPIIKENQVYDLEHPETLRVKRDTEEATYNFILEDLNNAISGLPKEREASEKYRLNRYSAAALKSRVMLFAASIAKYGTYNLDGLIGFKDPSVAKKYYEEAIKAAEIVISEGNYSLYDVNPNKSKNYQEMFWQKDLFSEVIFVKKFEYPNKTHNWDLWQSPWGYRLPEGYGSRLSPILELVETFDKIDGTSGKLKTNSSGWVVGEDGKIAEFDERTDLFDGYDPRLQATIMVPGSEWTNAKGNISGIIDVKKGLVTKENEKITIVKEGGSFTDTYNYTEGDTVVTVIGAQGLGGCSEVSVTGFYIKKFLYEGNAPYDPKQDSQEQDWFEFRYAEVLLNYAEAAAELASYGVDTYEDNGLIYLNEVRKRAGVAELDKLSIDDVRDEMRVEFLYENHRFWDLKRWRESEHVMNNVKFKGLYPYYVLNTKKWVFKVEEVGAVHSFQNYMYYNSIPSGEINTNPLLIQNPV